MTRDSPWSWRLRTAAFQPRPGTVPGRVTKKPVWSRATPASHRPGPDLAVEVVDGAVEREELVRRPRADLVRVRIERDADFRLRRHEGDPHRLLGGVRHLVRAALVRREEDDVPRPDLALPFRRA